MTRQITHRLFATLAITVAVLSSTATATALGLLSNSKSIQTYGAVKAVGVGVYWNADCTNTTSTINWGTLSPGTSKNLTFYVRNEANTAVQLTLTTQNWNPANAPNYMTPTWNRQGQTLTAGSLTAANLTLTLFSNIAGITNFSFDIIITGTEQ
jgi:hypothetical protein